MSQYKISLHDCNKDPDKFNNLSFKYRTVFWRDDTALSLGKLVRKRITTKTVLEVFKFWDSFLETNEVKEDPDWKGYLKRTLIKEYEPV
jgi:hypothetical protein